MVWNHCVQDTPNPVSLAVDRHVITLSLLASDNLFRSFSSDTQVWSSFTTGAWRFTAFINPALM